MFIQNFEEMRTKPRLERSLRQQSSRAIQTGNIRGRQIYVGYRQ